MKYFFVTIDTERDCSPDWSTSRPMTFKSILWGIPNIFDPIFRRWDVQPTYLLTVEVLENKECINTLKTIGHECELGTHLHGEFIDPNKKIDVYDGILTSDYSCFYNEKIEYEKLKNITILFKDKLGYNPKSFRAGRFGAGVQTLKSLEKLGYQVDSSVTPNIKWKNDQGIIDFTKAPLQPYRPDIQKDIQIRGNSAITEVPITIIKKIFSKRPIWLRPYISNAKEMVNILNWIEKNVRNENIYVNMMFHSMEIIPKASPYPQNDIEVIQYLNDLETVFSEAKIRGYRFIKLSEVKKYE